MKIISCFFLALSVCLVSSIAPAYDACYALLKIRLDPHHQQHSLNGLVLNPDADLVGSLTRAEVTHHEFFPKMARICNDLCAARDSSCVDYLAGSFIEQNPDQDPSNALKKLDSDYKKEYGGIKDTLKEPDCIYIKDTDTTAALQDHYSHLTASFEEHDVPFPIIVKIVEFWKALYQHLSLGTASLQDKILEDSLLLRRHQ